MKCDYYLRVTNVSVFMLKLKYYITNKTTDCRKNLQQSYGENFLQPYIGH